MDPIGVVTNVISLFDVIKRLDGLREKYKNAPGDVDAIVRECIHTEGMLHLIKNILKDNPESIDSTSTGKSLRTYFDRFAKGIERILKDYKKELAKLGTENGNGNGNGKSKFGFFEKTKFIWKEDYFKDTLQELRDMRDLVRFVMETMQL
jgi:hypothetical protein